LPRGRRLQRSSGVAISGSEVANCERV
jgi:hypothetical protein